MSTALKPVAAAAPGLNRRRSATPNWIAWGAMALAVVIALSMMYVPMSKETIGILTLVLVFDLLLLNVHIGIAMIVSALIGLYSLGGLSAMIGTLESAAFHASASWSLSVIPMFVLMGVVLFRGGVTASAYHFARQWLGRLPGGLAVATTIAGAGLAASSGSTIGIVNALGRMSLPEMLKSGYKPSFAAGSMSSVGILGQILPPSVLLVIYAGIAQTPVGPQLLAGVVPGLLLLVIFTLMIIAYGIVRPNVAPRVEKGTITWKSRLASIPSAIPLAAVIIVVVGGLASGIFTATEAAAFGVLASFVASIVTSRRSGRGLLGWLKFTFDSALSAAVGTASIFALLVGVQFLSRVIAQSRLAQGMAEWVSGLGLDKVTLLLLLVVVYLVLGAFIETLSMLILTLPVLTPILMAAEIDLLWFGVFVILLVEIGQLTPPLGILSFITHRIASDPEVNGGQKISLGQVFAGMAPYVVVSVLAAILLIFIPDIVTWLPNAVGGE